METPVETVRRESPFKLSRFCHVFERGSTLCLYHALGISPVYLDAGFRPLLDTLRRGLEADVRRIPSPVGHAETADLIAKLRAKKFLVTSDAEDDAQLRVLRERYLGHPTVGVMYLLVTDACNLSCEYCFVRNNMGPEYRTSVMAPELATRAIQFFAEQVSENKVEEPQVIFYGGEPLLNLRAVESAVEAVEKFKEAQGLPPRTQMTLITNGTRVTEEIARFLKAHNITVVVSVDGPEEITSLLRLSGTDIRFREIIRGLELLLAANVRVGISCTLGDASLVKFDAVLEWIRATGVNSVGFNIARPIPPFELSPDYSERVAEALIQGYTFLSDHGIAEDRMERKVRTFAEGTPYPFDCAGCGNQIVVAPDGRVGLCAGFLGTGEYFVTHVNASGFRPADDPAFLAWSQRSPIGNDECVACPAVALCGGGCPYSVKVRTGNLEAIDRIFCAHAKKTLEYLVWSLHERLASCGS